MDLAAAIANCSYSTGCTAIALALAAAIALDLAAAIAKSSDKTSVKNYRPISLLCNVPKVFERLIYDRVISTVAKSITPCQFGFQKGTSIYQLASYFSFSISL